MVDGLAARHRVRRGTSGRRRGCSSRQYGPGTGAEASCEKKHRDKRDTGLRAPVAVLRLFGQLHHPPPRYGPRPMRSTFNKVPRRFAASQPLTARKPRSTPGCANRSRASVPGRQPPEPVPASLARSCPRSFDFVRVAHSLRMTIGADRAGKSAITFTINFQLRTLILEAVLAGHLNESAFAKIFFAPRALGPAYPNERLQFILADGRDQSSIGCELLEQGARNSGHRCRHQYRVERRHLRPSLGTVGALEEHVRDAHRIQDYARTVLQPLDTFDRVNFPGEARQHRCLVTGAGADFEHALAARERRHLAHQRDHVWL